MPPATAVRTSAATGAASTAKLTAAAHPTGVATTTPIASAMAALPAGAATSAAATSNPSAAITPTVGAVPFPIGAAEPASNPPDSAAAALTAARPPSRPSEPSSPRCAVRGHEWRQLGRQCWLAGGGSVHQLGGMQLFHVPRKALRDGPSGGGRAVRRIDQP